MNCYVYQRVRPEIDYQCVERVASLVHLVQWGGGASYVPQNTIHYIADNLKRASSFSNGYEHTNVTKIFTSIHQYNIYSLISRADKNIDLHIKYLFTYFKRFWHKSIFPDFPIFRPYFDSFLAGYIWFSQKPKHKRKCAVYTCHFFISRLVSRDTTLIPYSFECSKRTVMLNMHKGY